MTVSPRTAKSAYPARTSPANSTSPALTLTNPDKTALTADGLTVNGDMFCNDGFTAAGEVRLPGAHITGQLVFTGATLTNPDRTALFADGLTVNGGMFCRDGFTATGEVRLLRAHITGQLSFSGATLTNPDKSGVGRRRAHRGRRHVLR